jgi:clan AA aspartic protease
MGSFSVPIKVSNWQNRYLPAERRGETLETDALVDTGAVELALPAELAERLRLEEIGSVQAETADGGFHRLRVLGMVEVEVQGRSAQVRVIELPRGARPLLGAVPLEEMDWHVSPREKKLVPNPRFPEGPVVPLM